MNNWSFNFFVSALLFCFYAMVVCIPSVPQPLNPFKNYGFVEGQSYRREWNYNPDKNPFSGNVSDIVKVVEIKNFWIRLDNGQEMSMQSAQYYNWFTLPADATKQ